MGKLTMGRTTSVHDHERCKNCDRLKQAGVRCVCRFNRVARSAIPQHQQYMATFAETHKLVGRPSHARKEGKGVMIAGRLWPLPGNNSPNSWHNVVAKLELRTFCPQFLREDGEPTPVPSVANGMRVIALVPSQDSPAGLIGAHLDSCLYSANKGEVLVSATECGSRAAKRSLPWTQVWEVAALEVDKPLFERHKAELQVLTSLVMFMAARGPAL